MKALTSHELFAEAIWPAGANASRRLSGVGPVLRMASFLTVVLLGSMFVKGTAAAQTSNEVILNATYLAAPTTWCPANAGVPMLVRMDGPDIIKGPNDFPRTVVVRRGGSARVVDGEHIDSFHRPEDFSGPNAEVIGRFAAEFQSCLSPWSSFRAVGTWRLSGSDGSDIDSGAITEEVFHPIYSLFFRPVAGSSKVRYAKFGDRLLFTADYTKTTTSQTFLAKPDEE